MNDIAAKFLAGFDIGSPTVIAKIDEAALALARLRMLVADMHGVSLAPPWKLADQETAPALDHGGGMTVAELVKIYRTHPQSNYQTISPRTRQNYDSTVKIILGDCGTCRLADLDAPRLRRLYDVWSMQGHFAMAHATMTVLRTILGFGAVVLETPDCRRAYVIATKERFAKRAEAVQ